MTEEFNAKFHIKCGELTCVDPTNLSFTCQFLGSRRFGTIPTCILYPSEKKEAYTELEEKNGFRLRCDQCLKKQREQNES